MDSPFATHTPVTRAASAPSSRDRRISTSLAAEVRDALSRRQRELPGRFLNDRAIAPLRRTITQRSAQRWHEIELTLVREWGEARRTSYHIRRVVQLLSGPSESALALLNRPADQPPLAGFLSVDTHLDLANEAVELATRRYPDLLAFPVVTDVSMPLPLRRASRTVFTLLGGALGRFSPVVAIRVLRNLRAVMAPDDQLLIGVDLRTACQRASAVVAPYDSLTDWHRHALHVLNRDVGTNIPVDRFAYSTRVSDDDRRLDEGLECQVATRIVGPFIDAVALRAGELLRTGVQHTYDRVMVQSMLRGVGLSLDGWHAAPAGEHALATATVLRHDDGQP